MTHTLRDYAQL